MREVAQKTRASCPLARPRRSPTAAAAAAALLRAQVDVDVFRSLGPKRADPLPGTSSFFQERLAAWRELNAAADWLEAAALLHPLCHSLPQLLHHQADVLDILLPRLRIDAALSLEPLLDLVGTLARDLQADFLPHLGRVLGALCGLVEGGADREPELLQHLFACLSLVAKHLCRLLAADPLPLLGLAQRLRHHAAPHVRLLAAQSLGYLLRHAPPAAARAAVRSVLAEAVLRPSEARVHGAAALVAAAVAGVGHGLHSRAAALLALLLRRDILAADDFAAGGASKERDADAEAGAEAAPERAAALDGETIEARVAAVAAECVSQLLDHVRRGTGGQLWALLHQEAADRLDALEAAGAAGADDAARAGARRAAARCVGLVAGAVEYFKGSRVEDYEPMFQLAARLSAPQFCAAGELAGAEEEEDGGGEAEEREDAAFLAPSLPAQTLRLMQALSAAHQKAAGASRGPAAIEQAAPRWAVVFASAPPADVLRYVRAAVEAPGGAEVARCCGPQLLGAVGRRLLAGRDEGVCWPLLMDLCATLAGASAIGALPVVLTAAGVGPQLAAHVRAAAAGALAGGRRPSERQLAAAWAAVHCLPHAAESGAQALACCQALVDATGAALGAPGADEGGAGADGARLLMLHATARGMLAFLAARHAAERLEGLVREALALLEGRPGDYHAAMAAAETLNLARGAGVALPQDKLASLAPLLAPNLGSPAAPLRVETLRVLCAFEQPALQAVGAEAGAAAAGQACDALPQLLQLESRPPGADAGRQGCVALGRVRTYLEYRRLPEALVGAVVQELLGVLHIRRAALPSARAQAAALLSFAEKKKMAEQRGAAPPGPFFLTPSC
jgi:U3 small nucleolar RNA-associated protein 20